MPPATKRLRLVERGDGAADRPSVAGYAVEDVADRLDLLGDNMKLPPASLVAEWRATPGVAASGRLAFPCGREAGDSDRPIRLRYCVEEGPHHLYVGVVAPIRPLGEADLHPGPVELAL